MDYSFEENKQNSYAALNFSVTLLQKYVIFNK